MITKYILVLLSFALAIASCESSKKTTNSQDANATVINDTIRIANDSLEYEIIIIEPGFQGFLVTQPPRGFYGQTFLELKNRVFVIEYNQRVRSPQQFDYNLYPMTIDYDLNVDYGYEVNYLLYNYFLYFQKKYNQRFTGGRN